jgi:hypothetical protein
VFVQIERLDGFFFAKNNGANDASHNALAVSPI